MANNYFQFAEQFDFPEKAARDFMAVMTGLEEAFSARYSGQEPQRVVPSWWLKENGAPKEDLADWLEEEMDYYGDPLTVIYDKSEGGKPGKLYVGSEENGDLNMTARVLSQVMKRHDVREPVVISGAFTCDKARPGEFGGSVVCVGPGMVEGGDTTWLGDKLKREMLEKLGDAPKAGKKQGPKA